MLEEMVETQLSLAIIRRFLFLVIWWKSIFTKLKME